MNMWGHNLRLSIFGESHGPGIGIVIDGLPPGMAIDEDEILFEMGRRAPGASPLSTARAEADTPKILSGFLNGKTTGAPLCAVIENNNTRSSDYDQNIPRPAHADFPAYVKFGPARDMRGGGHFSGRLTAPLVFAGAIAKQFLKRKNILIFSHISGIGDVRDEMFDPVNPESKGYEGLKHMPLPVLSSPAGEAMRNQILAAKEEGDSVGGSVECMAVGHGIGLGEPFFLSFESHLSSLIFSIPGAKALSFGAGLDFAKGTGSLLNDPYYLSGGEVKTKTNNTGGIQGGLTNAMPVVFEAVFRPTPSIAKEQASLSLSPLKEAKLSITGRHDPCIVPRALPSVEAAAALTIFDFMLGENLWKNY